MAERKPAIDVLIDVVGDNLKYFLDKLEGGYDWEKISGGPTEFFLEAAMVFLDRSVIADGKIEWLKGRLTQFTGHGCFDKLPQSIQKQITHFVKTGMFNPH